MKIIFKHSTKCPTSRRAKKEMDTFLKNNQQALEYEFVDVIDNRDRSNEIEKQYGIQHESPQIIILDNNDNVIWDASHRAITEESINNAISSTLTRRSHTPDSPSKKW
jgi:bacillithiol system protein YtxJ